MQTQFIYQCHALPNSKNYDFTNTVYKNHQTPVLVRHNKKLFAVKPKALLKHGLKYAVEILDGT